MPKKQEKQDTLVELGDKVKGKIELPKFDVTPYIGQKKKVEKVEEHEGSFGYFIKVLTEPVATLGNGDNAKEVRASRIFGLAQDADGNIGWDDTTKLGIYLKKMGVEHYRDLVGKEVILQSQTNDDGVDFLTFN